MRLKAAHIHDAPTSFLLWATGILVLVAIFGSLYLWIQDREKRKRRREEGRQQRKARKRKHH